MNFRTQVELPERVTEIRYSDRLMLFGSCFVENIGNLLATNKFVCDVNPYGVLYNPLSIADGLRRILRNPVFTADELFPWQGLWHSWMHHGSFSAASPEECLERINARLQAASEMLPVADWLIVTWGTAFVYKHEGKIVGNCHKLPAGEFDRFCVDADLITESWHYLLKDLKALNPKLKVLFTVSPIRHAKDGMHGNQLSKARLLLAIEELCRESGHCFYFPSYEILLDELRDYRFYADDMLHPSPLAVEYIWECFGRCYFKDDTRHIMKEWQEIQKGLQHKPFHPESEAYRQFLSQIMLKIERMKEKFPYIKAQKETELCQTLLKI
ncbi:MAG: GSCFA domain-containing protein [Bacteroides sp.]|nr:GSCFA domain-containing protein [Bacteroides sp.]